MRNLDFLLYKLVLVWYYINVNKTTRNKEEKEMTIIISKKIKSNGYTAYENWMFHKTIGGNEPCASHYINNRKGTFYQKLGTIFFNNGEEGNEKFKELRSKGFEVTEKY